MASGAKLPNTNLNLIQDTDMIDYADINAIAQAVEANATDLSLIDITESKNNSRVIKSNGFIVAYRTVRFGTVISAAYGGTTFPFPYTFRASPFVAMCEIGDVQNPSSFDINTDLALTSNPSRDGWQIRSRLSDVTLVNDIVLFVAGFETF